MEAMLGGNFIGRKWGENPLYGENFSLAGEKNSPYREKNPAARGKNSPYGEFQPLPTAIRFFV